MIKKIISLIIAVLLIGTTEVFAQSFLKKLGEGLEKAAKEAVQDASNKKKKSSNNRSNSSQSNRKSSSKTTNSRKAVVASKDNSEEERVITLPPRDHALLKPIGDPDSRGTVEFVCPTPPDPSQDLIPWAEKLEQIENLTNESLLKEIKLLEPLLQREKYIINAMIGRYDQAYKEFNGRLKALGAIHNHIRKMYDSKKMNDPQWVINGEGAKLVRTLSSSEYKRALNSSIKPFRAFFDKSTITYFDGFNKNWDEIRKDLVNWIPYPETQIASAADRATAAANSDAVIAILNSDMVTARYEALTFRLLKTYCRVIKFDKAKTDNQDLVIPAKIIVEGKIYPVTEIGEYALSGCGAKTIRIPNTVTALYREAFSGLTRVKTIEIPTSVKKIDPFCFSQCKELTEFHIPSSVTLVDGYAFAECPKLTTVTFPTQMRTVGDHIFTDCPSLTSVKLPENIKRLGESFFGGCKSLTSLEVPKTVTYIGRSAFAGCSSLTSITLPKGLTEIDNDAFNGCSKLTSLHIPSTVTEIGTSTLDGCKAIKSVTLPSKFKDLKELYWLFQGSGLFAKDNNGSNEIPSCFKFEDN